MTKLPNMSKHLVNAIHDRYPSVLKKYEEWVVKITPMTRKEAGKKMNELRTQLYNGKELYKRFHYQANHPDVELPATFEEEFLFSVVRMSYYRNLYEDLPIGEGKRSDGSHSPLTWEQRLQRFKDNFNEL